ncbi:hypothetical protein ICW40_07535 [Actinotalea ferrariae]|uniref:hypothetical protein n=1 Tax=Actinotalea ferrariae TaxID=1386098 RepID=UPI001C8BB351|nr:hypothetical protein [Actinotalea ferrariae]MBX9244661.1 hypothetical protein [Actinotalea ferrariae]
MPTTTINDQYLETTRLSIHEVVRRLNGVLGPTLVSTAAGTSDRKAAIRWAKADSGRIRAEFENRLRLAYRAMTAIAEVENAHVARAWFISANPLLGEDTPILAIREDRHRDVVRAFTAVATGDWAG